MGPDHKKGNQTKQQHKKLFESSEAFDALVLLHTLDCYLNGIVRLKLVRRWKVGKLKCMTNFKTKKSKPQENQQTIK